MNLFDLLPEDQRRQVSDPISKLLSLADRTGLVIRITVRQGVCDLTLKPLRESPFKVVGLGGADHVHYTSWSLHESASDALAHFYADFERRALGR